MRRGSSGARTLTRLLTVALPFVVMAATGGAVWSTMSSRGDAAALRVVDPISISTLDPAQVSWLQDIRVVTQLYEGLYSADPDGSGVRPACSEPAEVTAADRLGRPTAFRFRIRPEACWSDGQPVRAADFIYAWRRAVEPGTARDYSQYVLLIRGMTAYQAWRQSEIERIGRLPGVRRAEAAESHRRDADGWFSRRVGLRAEGDRNLLVELERPVAYWLDLLALPVFLPVHRPTVESCRRDDDSGLTSYDPRWCRAGRTAYNGPYVLERWSFKRGLLLRKNPRFRGAGDVTLPAIEYLDVADPNTAWLMYDTGRADLLLSLDTAYSARLVADSRSPLATALNHGAGRRSDIHAFATFGTYFYNFNCADRFNDGRANPLRSAALRRALALTIDRAALCRAVLRRGEPAAPTLVPSGAVADYPVIDGVRFDVDRARSEFESAVAALGGPPGEITILFNNEGVNGLLAQSVAAMWRQHLGLTVRLVGKESQTYRDDKQRHDFMVAAGSWFGDYADPTTFLDVLRSDSGNNDSAFRDEAYDAALDAAEALTDRTQRLAALAQCEQGLLAEAAPVAPIYHYVNVYACDTSRVGGLALSPRLIIPFGGLRVSR